MGIFSKLFGGSSTRCSECGSSFEPNPMMMTIITATIDNWSLQGVGGYCPRCNKYVCWKHLEFKEEGSMTYVTAHKACGTAIRPSA